MALRGARILLEVQARTVLDGVHLANRRRVAEKVREAEARGFCEDAEGRGGFVEEKEVMVPAEDVLLLALVRKLFDSVRHTQHVLAAKIDGQASVSNGEGAVAIVAHGCVSGVEGFGTIAQLTLHSRTTCGQTE